MVAATRLRRLRVPFPIRLRWASARARLVRHYRARRAVVAIAALVWFVLVSDAAVARRDALRAWGESQPVLVAGTAAEIGESLSSAQPELADRPSALVADDALLRPVAEGRLAWPVRAGEVITARHLLDDPVLVPAGRRAIDVPIDRPEPRLGVGSAVEAILIGDPYGPGSTSRAVPATVLAVSADSVTIGLTPGDALAVAETLASGQVTIVRR